MNTQEVRAVLQGTARCFVTGGGSLTGHFRLNSLNQQSPGEILSCRHLNQIKEFSVADQVLVVGAGADIEVLNQELASKGYCLPAASQDLGQIGSIHGTLASVLSLNLPHVLSSQCGSWRDWILGMTLVRPDGTICKCGSKAVKNVAGYDVQRLMVGARGTLGVIVELILRVAPIKSVPAPQAKKYRELRIDAPLWIQRVRLSDFAIAEETGRDHLVLADPASGTLWATLATDQFLKRYDGDWVIRSGVGTRNLELTDPTQIRLMKRAKEIFDPTGKLNPGEMGIF